MKRSKVTIKEVAERANVSVATVSHVINKSRFVSEETRQRVFKAIRELGYRPNVLARNLRRKKTNTIGVVICDLENPFFLGMLRGIDFTLGQHGFDMLVTNTSYDDERERRTLEMLYSKQVDGVILVPGRGGSEEISFLVDMGIPVVVLDKRLSIETEVDVVEASNFQGSKEMVKHLIKIGHKRIGIITGPQDTSTGKQRLEGALEALVESGIPVEEELIVEGNFKKESGVEIIERFLSFLSPPTVVFACNFPMGIGAFEVLKQKGVRVPEEMGIAIFDDLPWFEYIDPPITAVRQPSFEMGKVGAELLIERIRKRRKRVKEVVLKTKLAIRLSAGEGLKAKKGVVKRS